jgi:hypothetical protein
MNIAGPRSGTAHLFWSQRMKGVIFIAKIKLWFFEAQEMNLRFGPKLIK